MRLQGVFLAVYMCVHAHCKPSISFTASITRCPAALDTTRRGVRHTFLISAPWFTCPAWYLRHFVLRLAKSGHLELSHNVSDCCSSTSKFSFWGGGCKNIKEFPGEPECQYIIIVSTLWSWPNAVSHLCLCLSHLMHRSVSWSFRALRWQSSVVSFNRFPPCSSLASVPWASHLTTVSPSLQKRIRKLLPF